MEIPERVINEVRDAAPVMGDNDDWMVLKKFLLLQLPPKMRTLFSTRHPKTKKQSLNEFEEALIAFYEELTGVKLSIKQ